MDVKEVRQEEVVDWVNKPQDRDKCGAVLNIVMNLLVP
jgi:hypothetical protein